MKKLVLLSTVLSLCTLTAYADTTASTQTHDKVMMKQSEQSPSTVNKEVKAADKAHTKKHTKAVKKSKHTQSKMKSNTQKGNAAVKGSTGTGSTTPDANTVNSDKL